MDGCTEKIISNDYADFIFRDGAYVRELVSGVTDYCITKIDSKWSVIHIAISGNPPLTYDDYGYSSFPKVYGLMDLSALDASGVSSVRQQPVLSLRGSGTLVGIVDTGINYMHEAFRYSNGTSRIAAIWDQTNQSGKNPELFEYGSEYTNEDINNALASQTPLQIVPVTDEPSGHGTFLAGIAAGNENLTEQVSGVAPLAEIVVVKLKPAKQYLRDFYYVRDGAIAYSESDLMTGVEYLSRYADRAKKPISICIGVGSNLGSHGGTAPLGNLITDVAGEIGRAVFIAGGNEGINRLHYGGTRSKTTEFDRVEIRVGENEKGFVCELWTFAPEIYSVEFISPTGQVASRVQPRVNTTTRLDFVFEDTKIYVYYRIIEPLSGENVVVVKFDKPAQGIWVINIYGKNIVSGKYNLWINNKEFLSSDTYFIMPDAYITLTEPSNVPQAIAITAYDDTNSSLYTNAGRGYNIYDTVKPDVAAPGVNIKGPLASRDNAYTERSGTSIAAALATGIGALLLEYGIIKGRVPYMRTADIKNILITGADRSNTITYPNREWGYGKIDVYKGIEVYRFD